MTAQSFPNPFKSELPAGEPIIIMSRTFNAPLSLVWKVWTEKSHVAYWFGPGDDNEVVDYDVRTGGRWRIVSTMQDGSRIVFFGTYLAVEPTNMIRNTFVVEGQFEENPQFYEEHHFEERDGKTYYRSISKVDSVESRDAIVATGMEWGANISMVKVDELLERLKA